jgi:hypothetical protein
MSEVIFATGNASRFSAEQHKKVSDELARWARERIDIVIPYGCLSVDSVGNVKLKDQNLKLFRVQDRIFADYQQADQYLDELLKAQLADSSVDPVDQPDIRIECIDDQDIAGIRFSQRARTQLFGHLGIPVRYANRQGHDGNGDLVWQHADALLDRKRGSCLLRILDGEVKAILSSRYRILDSWKMFEHTLQIIDQSGAEIMEAKLLDGGFELTACRKDMVQNVNNYLAERPDNSHLVDRPDRDGGIEQDAHYAMMTIQNRESGDGTARIGVAILRGACLNTLILRQPILSLRHVGSDMSLDRAADLIISAKTRDLIAVAEMSKIQDAVTRVFDPDSFATIMHQLAATKTSVIPDGREREACQAVLQASGLSGGNVDQLLKKLLGSRDLSQFGLIQAVTAMAHDCDDDEQALGFQQAGGVLLEVPVDNFNDFINRESKKFENAKEEDDSLVLI